MFPSTLKRKARVFKLFSPKSSTFRDGLVKTADLQSNQVKRTPQDGINKLII